MNRPGNILQFIALVAANELLIQASTHKSKRPRKQARKKSAAVKVATTKKVVNEEFTDFVVISSKPLNKHQ